jgi:hypothetical protein|nr:MAG TPA: GIY-YIG nuclease superfamily protein [Bacteriophage sp.]
MDYNKFRQAKAIEAKNKKRLLEVNPYLNEGSGIYFLTRTDENGFKYAYVGQAVHILTRLAQHMVGYQHIDLSIKKHGLYSKQNQNGWKIDFNSYPEVVLNEMEQLFIKEYADQGYQLRNKTSGSQGDGKAQIDDYRPQKGYRDGIQQGRKNMARELSSIAEKHLKIELRADKANNKVSQKQYEKFMDLLKVGDSE